MSLFVPLRERLCTLRTQSIPLKGKSRVNLVGVGITLRIKGNVNGQAQKEAPSPAFFFIFPRMEITEV